MGAFICYVFLLLLSAFVLLVGGIKSLSVLLVGGIKGLSVLLICLVLGGDSYMYVLETRLEICLMICYMCFASLFPVVLLWK